MKKLYRAVLSATMLIRATAFGTWWPPQDRAIVRFTWRRPDRAAAGTVCVQIVTTPAFSPEEPAALAAATKK